MCPPQSSKKKVIVNQFFSSYANLKGTHPILLKPFDRLIQRPLCVLERHGATRGAKESAEKGRNFVFRDYL